jgi:PadR family transcriptional regulator PadR
MAIQVTGTLLDACVLAMLTEGDAYGYSLTQSIRETLEVSESTLYPVMRRLQTDECLTTYDEPHSGRNRRYYKITDRGMEKYRACLEEWDLFKKRIDSILGGGSNDQE